MYDFSEPVERRNTSSRKWDSARKRLSFDQAAADPLPMWVADMDFRVAKPIRDALRRQVVHGVFGYTDVPDTMVHAVLQWQKDRFGWLAEREWMVQSPSVVNALNIAIQTFTLPGECVLMLAPVYAHFHDDAILNGRHAVQAPLELGHDGRYRFDAAAFEAAMPDDTRLFLLSNPHNPTGNVWTREELVQMGEICLRRGIIVVSDEVHQDLVFGEGAAHHAWGLLDDALVRNSIICTAPSKTFNLAGLQCANIVIPDERMRREYLAAAERFGLNYVNLMGIAACEAAYARCGSWADQMLRYVKGNQLHFRAQVEQRQLPIRVLPMDSLYLAWIDFRKLGMFAGTLHDFLLRKARLWLDPGAKYGAGGAGFMRINLACPRQTVDLALDRLTDALASPSTIKEFS
jgi:cystathionine beta-lyase